MGDVSDFIGAIPLEKPKPAKCATCAGVIDGHTEAGIRARVRKHYQKFHPQEWRRFQAYEAGTERDTDILRREFLD